MRKYLKAARAELNMTQQEVAAAIGASRNTVIKLEAGLTVDEGLEGRAEKLYGWKLGSLDRIRDGGEPESAVPLDAAPEPEPDAVNEEMLESLHHLTEQLVGTPVEVISHEEADEFIERMMRNWQKAEPDRGRYLRTLERFREEDALRYAPNTERKSHTPNE